MASRRAERVAEAIKEEVSLIIREEAGDPRLGFLTVTAVELSNDLRYAKIFISVYGGREEKTKTWQGLRSATRFIRKEIGRRIKLRWTPEIIFKWDESVEKGAYINNLLGQLGQGQDKGVSNKNLKEQEKPQKLTTESTES